MKTYHVYIMTNKKYGTLYIGVTNNLIRRVYEHQHNIVKGFTEKYSCHKLVYYAGIPDVSMALQRERQMKKWKRLWKIRVIQEMNPDWDDLSEEW